MSSSVSCAHCPGSLIERFGGGSGMICEGVSMEGRTDLRLPSAIEMKSFNDLSDTLVQ